MKTRIDDETLIAYLDGELAPELTHQMEAALAVDPDLAVKVDALRRVTAALRAAFNEPLHAAVPARLVETVEAGFAERARTAPRRAANRLLAGPIAASIVALTIGLGGAYLFTEWQVERTLARLAAVRAADERMIEAAVARALESHVSGTPAHWRNPDSGSSGAVEPVRTFRSSSGQWCREYVLNVELRAPETRRETRRAIACREADGQWRTRVEMTEES